jgi:hypothetical protein
MPDVGLTTASEPVPADTKVIIRYSVEVGGLPVYNESYDVDKLTVELAEDQKRVLEIWSWRLLCAVRCRHKHGFSACLTRCLTDGESCACGHAGCEAIGNSSAAGMQIHAQRHVKESGGAAPEEDNS